MLFLTLNMLHRMFLNVYFNIKSNPRGWFKFKEKRKFTNFVANEKNISI